MNNRRLVYYSVKSTRTNRPTKRGLFAVFRIAEGEEKGMLLFLGIFSRDCNDVHGRQRRWVRYCYHHHHHHHQHDHHLRSVYRLPETPKRLRGYRDVTFACLLISIFESVIFIIFRPNFHSFFFINNNREDDFYINEVWRLSSCGCIIN